MSRSLRRSVILSTASALIVSLTAFLPMILSGHITRDSGVFLYTGMVVSRGGMPYVDSWDHKGPLLALFEMVAWNMGGGIVGAPLLEAIALFAGLAVAGALWARWLREGAAIVVLVVGVNYLAVYEGGNFTETWLFPFQIVAYSTAAYVAVMLGQHASFRLVVALGAVVGLAVAVGLFTRMNNAVGCVLLVLGCWSFVRRRAAFGVTVLVVVGVVGALLSLWLWGGNALRAAIDQYLRYNLFYSGGTPVGERLDAFATLSQILISGAVVAVTLVVVTMWVAIRANRAGASDRQSGVVVAFLLLGGVDALSQMASGRSYPHYLVVAIAGFSVALVVAARGLLPLLGQRWSQSSGVRQRARVVTALIAVFCFLVSSSASTAAQSLHATMEAGVFLKGSYQALIVNRVLAETSPNDRVLVHGAETWILASSQRLSPTAITYSLPVEQGYGGLEGQYLADITAFAPALIVESPTSCGISVECPPDKDRFDGLAPWVASHYELEGDVVGFRFWRRVSL